MIKNIKNNCSIYGLIIVKTAKKSLICVRKSQTYLHNNIFMLLHISKSVVELFNHGNI
jgi:hypothetical protein